MKKSEPDLNAVKVLLDVVQAGGFSAAARRQGVPANRLSRQVQRMEEQLGVRLLQRSTRRLSLTSAGRMLVDASGTAMQRITQAWLEAGAQADEPAGHLRVAAPADFLSVLSVQPIAEFLERYPAVTLELLLSDDEADLLSGGIDLAFRGGPILDESLIARRIAHSAQVIVAAPQWVQRHGDPTQPQAFASLPCLAVRRRNGIGNRGCVAQWRLKGPEGDVSIEVQARLAVNSMGALLMGARAGLGAALVPAALAAEDLAAGSLQRLLPDHAFETGGFFAVYPSRRHHPAAMLAFIDFVIARAGRMPS